MQVVMEKMKSWNGLSFEDARKLVVEKADEAYKNGRETDYVFLVYARYCGCGNESARIAGCLPGYHVEHYIMQFNKIHPEATYNIVMYSPRWDFLDGNFCNPCDTHLVRLRWENLEYQMEKDKRNEQFIG